MDELVTSLRVPTDTGQVGLRPRSEPAALVVEPGLVLANGRHGLLFVATAGGLLRCDRDQAVLLTPLAVVGDSAESVQMRLGEALRAPRADTELRGMLGRLEAAILQEVRGGETAAPARGRGLG